MIRDREAEIVFVEDNPHDMEMIVESLRDQNLGNRVAVLKDGAEALEYFFGPDSISDLSSSKAPKVVVLDLKLPKVNGLEVLRQLKSDNRTRDIPIVIFTSSDEECDRIESYRMGANSYAVKPLDSDQFARVVSEIGRYWLFLNKSSHNN